jgi:alpha-1,2-mannosyltransferase
MRSRTGTVLLWTLASVSLLLLVYEAWTLVGSVLTPLLTNPRIIQTDFHYYYEAAQRFSREPRTLYRFADDVIGGFAYPPPAIVPFVWLSRWPLGTALLALTILSYLMIGVATQQWFKYLRAHGHFADRATAIAIVVIVLALGPTYMNAIFGQVNAFVLASAVAFVRLAPTAAFEAGLALALGAWLKIYPAYLVVIGLWERSTWKAIGWAIAIGILIMILLLPIVPWQAYRDFIAVLDARVDKTAIHFTNQSLPAFLERFRYSSDLFLYWTGQQAVTVPRFVRAFMSWLTVISAGVLWKSRLPREKKAAALIALIPVLAPLGWGHTYVMVLPLVILHLISITNAAPAKALAIFLCVVAMMVPAGRHLPIDAAPDWLENVVYSRYLLATIALIFISSARGVGQKTESTVITSA